MEKPSCTSSSVAFLVFLLAVLIIKKGKVKHHRPLGQCSLCVPDTDPLMPEMIYFNLNLTVLIVIKLWYNKSNRNVFLKLDVHRHYRKKNDFVLNYRSCQFIVLVKLGVTFLFYCCDKTLWQRQFIKEITSLGAHSFGGWVCDHNNEGWQIQVLEQYPRVYIFTTSTQQRGLTWNGVGFLKFQNSSPTPTHATHL